jgi:hypothetical protein
VVTTTTTIVTDVATVVAIITAIITAIATIITAIITAIATIAAIATITAIATIATIATVTTVATVATVAMANTGTVLSLPISHGTQPRWVGMVIDYTSRQCYFLFDCRSSLFVLFFTSGCLFCLALLPRPLFFDGRFEFCK